MPSNEALPLSASQLKYLFSDLCIKLGFCSIGKDEKFKLDPRRRSMSSPEPSLLRRDSTQSTLHGTSTEMFERSWPVPLRYPSGTWGAVMPDSGLQKRIEDQR